MVLNVLSPQSGVDRPEDLTVDIVAVHGLNGDPTTTWTDPKAKTFWLRDYLPNDIKSARVMSFGYNADTLFGNTTADIWDHAKMLLVSLQDKRIKEHEESRPIIFIAHSLGGIVVKQALVWANTEPQYKKILDHTIGIVFFGTPHQGSVKANYGNVLAHVATSVMHKPKPRLVKDLKSNSSALMNITRQFKYLSNLRIVTFYEMKPMAGFSSLIVEKHSALLGVNGEDQVGLNANHRDMCKFGGQEHETYQMLVIRLKRMLKGKDSILETTLPNQHLPLNKYYEISLNVISIFTGRETILRELQESCLPPAVPHTQKERKISVLYGLGGSGKTQVCLKFAQDNRERFWGIFFIDASSSSTIDQGLSAMAEKCGVGKSTKAFKCHLRDITDPWLLIFDNADDPSLQIATYFPVGNRGTIIVTTRNPQCKIHATVQSHQFSELKADDAVTLLLRASDLPNDECTRKSAVPVVQTLGYLALAIVHAGALIRQRICTLDDYCGIYELRRKDLLIRRPAQATDDYKYTVYTTWEISVASIEDSAKDTSSVTAANALDLLKLFGFFHFDNISEGFFKKVWELIPINSEKYPWTVSNQLRMFREDRPQNWDPLTFREAVNLLANYSLVQINGNYTHISLHPLVHSWIEDSLDLQSKLIWRTTGLSTLALASDIMSHEMNKRLESHVRSCLASSDLKDFLIDDQFAWERTWILRTFAALIYQRGSSKEASGILESVVAYCRKVFSETPEKVCQIALGLAYYYHETHEHQKALDVLESLPSWKDVVEDFLAVRIMSRFANLYEFMGRDDEALKWALEGFELAKTFANQYEHRYVAAKLDLARACVVIDRAKEAVGLMEGVVEHVQKTQSENVHSSLYFERELAKAYAHAGEHRQALDLFEGVYLKRVDCFGDMDYDTLISAAEVAIYYCKMSRLDDGMKLLLRTIETGQRTGVDDTDLQYWKQWLDYMENHRYMEDYSMKA